MEPKNPGNAKDQLPDPVTPFSSRLRSDPLIGVVDEVVRLQGRFSDLFEEPRELSGVNRLESTVLTAVLEALTPPTVPQIGRSLGHPRQVIQRAVNELLSRGLLKKQPNPDHKRVPLLVGTDKAYESKRVTDGLALKITGEFYREFDREWCRRIENDLYHLREAMEKFVRRRKNKKPE